MATTGTGNREAALMSNGTRTFVTMMLHYGQQPYDHVIRHHIREHKHTYTAAEPLYKGHLR